MKKASSPLLLATTAAAFPSPWATAQIFNAARTVALDASNPLSLIALQQLT